MGYKNSVKLLSKEIPIKNGCFLITGATGLIGSCIIDALLEANQNGSNVVIYAMSRSAEKIKRRFGESVIPIVQDVTETLNVNKEFDYIIHCASNADPKKYASYPVETILTNVLGSMNMLNYCRKFCTTRMLFVSTFEIYGVSDGDGIYNEKKYGAIDLSLLRNCYPESKRTCELLVRSYVEEYGINAVIVRLPSVYGPTMDIFDSKAHAQFIRNAINHEDIVLKSEGQQVRTYCYVIDAVSGIFKVLFEGDKGDMYNVSNENSVASILQVAETCAVIAKTNVVHNIPTNTEEKGFSQITNCILDNSKLRSLGWNAQFSLRDGMEETIAELSFIINSQSD